VADLRTLVKGEQDISLLRGRQETGVRKRQAVSSQKEVKEQ